MIEWFIEGLNSPTPDSHWFFMAAGMALMAILTSILIAVSGNECTAEATLLTPTAIKKVIPVGTTRSRDRRKKQRRT